MLKFLKKAKEKFGVHPGTPSPDELFPLRLPLPLPPGISEEDLFNHLISLRIEGAPEEEIRNYCRQDFRRFVHTYGLCREHQGRCLELGSNPYFTTMLLRDFTSLQTTLANYFSPEALRSSCQKIFINDPLAAATREMEMSFDHFNIELEEFPYPDNFFDLVLFCEILEHLVQDPVKVLREIKRVLRPGGMLVLTTPNACRLENVARMVAGVNTSDPYSAYGPYGRHNREYTRHEIYLLLKYLGFTITEMFTADVHYNHSGVYASLPELEPLLRFRKNDLGQYIFVRAENDGLAGARRPGFLFRSYPADETERVE